MIEILMYMLFVIEGSAMIIMLIWIYDAIIDRLKRIPKDIRDIKEARNPNKCINCDYYAEGYCCYHHEGTVPEGTCESFIIKEVTNE